MIVTGIECLKCGDKIWSRHRHDCRSCKCGACYIDGGRDYTRVGAESPADVRGIEIEIPG